MAIGRLFIAYIVLRIWLRLKAAGQPSTTLTHWASYLQAALFGHALPLVLIAAASMKVPAGEMAVLVATTPFFAVALSHLFPPTLPARSTILGLLTGLLGLLAFFGVPEAEAPRADWLARLALLCAAFSYAVSGRAVAKLPAADSVATGAAVTLCAVSMLVPVGLVLERPWTILPTRGTIAAVVLLGIASTAVAYVAYYRLISLGGPAFASLHHYLVPVLSALFAASCLGEFPQARHILSAVAIALGVYLLRGLSRPSQQP